MTDVNVRQFDLRVLNMETRIPFEYGIVTLTALPHLLIFIEVESDGRREWGVAADGLAPKWFTKNPDDTYQEEVERMLSVIRTACGRVRAYPEHASVFDLWWDLYHDQYDWGADQSVPPLLTGFGVSLVERAVLDGFCRLHDTPLRNAVHAGALGIEPGRVHDDLSGMDVSDGLPDTTPDRLIARHTVGLSDPLREADVSPADRIEDGLPQSLASCVDQYGLTHFKIKLPGEKAEAVDRLTTINDLLRDRMSSFAFSLDGNEFFHDAEAFRDYWANLLEHDRVRSFLEDGLLFVEQPLHREAALSDNTADVLADWDHAPPIIIDESDGALESLPRALSCGYRGTSHKNCKGVMKGIVNRCLIGRISDRGEGESVLMSAEDLSSVGPVALLQDLSVIALLGIEHAERNGHHYFPGLSMFPPDLQEHVLERHGDLYHRHETDGRSFPSLTLNEGQISLHSVKQAPFGYDLDLDRSMFLPLAEWSFDSIA